MLKDQKGFSLVHVIIAAGILGGLSLVLLNLVKNTNDAQIFSQSKSDEMELRSSLRLILDNENFCRVSLAGDGLIGFPDAPVKFYKQDIDEVTEGLNVALYLATQDGQARSMKKFNGANNVGAEDKSEFGKLKINSIKLIMNNPTGTGLNYPNLNNHSDVGILRVEFSKKISIINSRESKMDFDVKIMMSTGVAPDAPGESRILSCTRVNENEIESFTYPQSCSMTLSQSDNGGPFRNAVLNMNSGGFAALRLIGDVDHTDRFRLSSSCGAGNKLDTYLSSCSIGFGWRFNARSTSPIVATPNPPTTHEGVFGSSLTFQTNNGLPTAFGLNDVDDDDAFYFRIRCPNGSDPKLDTYMKKKCQICFAHSDHSNPTMDRVACKKLQNSLDSSWERVLFAGNVGDDDSLFLGFFCEGEYSPLIKSWTY